MKFIAVILLLLTLKSAYADNESCGVLDIESRLLNSDEVKHLCLDYPAKAYLIVNTASLCAFTPQFKELNILYQKYHSQGLQIFAFPSSDFVGQEFASEAKIKNYCDTKFKIKFPIFAKTRVKGADASALYLQLAERSQPPRWNFHKYLVDGNGNVINSYASMTRPNNKTLEEDIQALLQSLSDRK